LANVSVIRDQFSHVNVTISIADFSNFKNDENCNAEINEVGDDVEVHN
jgi:hypothetical protein